MVRSRFFALAILALICAGIFGPARALPRVSAHPIAAPGVESAARRALARKASPQLWDGSAQSVADLDAEGADDDDDRDPTLDASGEPSKPTAGAASFRQQKRESRGGSQIVPRLLAFSIAIPRGPPT